MQIDHILSSRTRAMHLSRRTFPLALLLLLPSRVQPEAKPAPYSYKTLFSTQGPVSGKQPLAIKSLDFNDQGDVAMLVICADGPAIWVESRHAWVAARGTPMTAATGEPTTILNLYAPSLSATGAVRYAADYWVGGPGNIRHGYFVDNKLIYETTRSITAEAFTSDNRVVLAMPEPVIADGTIRTGKLPSFYPAGVTWGPPEHLFIHPQSGADAFIALVPQNNGAFVAAYFVKKSLSLTVAPGPQSNPNALMLNGRDDIAYSNNAMGNVIFLNHKPTARKGKLDGFTDERDMLYETVETPEQIDRVRMNDTVVIERGNSNSYGANHPIRLGVPTLKEKGFVFGYQFPKMNNKRQVAFAVQFLPVGQFPTYGSLGQNVSDIQVKGLKVPWEVMIATPVR